MQRHRSPGCLKAKKWMTRLSRWPVSIFPTSMPDTRLRRGAGRDIICLLPGASRYDIDIESTGTGSRSEVKWHRGHSSTAIPFSLSVLFNSLNISPKNLSIKSASSKPNLLIKFWYLSCALLTFSSVVTLSTTGYNEFTASRALYILMRSKICWMC